MVRAGRVGIGEVRSRTDRAGVEGLSPAWQGQEAFRVQSVGCRVSIAKGAFGGLHHRVEGAGCGV